jgi:hypothetical protein
MTIFTWNVAAGGAFNTPGDWSQPGVPGAADTAILPGFAGAAYTVTSNSGPTVSYLQTAANATLSITGSTFSDTAGTGSGVNAGTIAVGDNGTFSVGGTFDNTGAVNLNSYNPARMLIATATMLTGSGVIDLVEGTYAASNELYGATATTTLTNVSDTIKGAGLLGAGQLTLINQAAGVIDASEANHQLILNTGSAVVTNGGLIEATGAAGLSIVGTTINNATGGTLLANNSVIDLQSTDIQGGTLSTLGTGSFQANDRGSTLDGTSKTNKLYVLGNFTIGGSGTTVTIDGTINLTKKVGTVVTNGVITVNSYNPSILTVGVKNASLVGSQVDLLEGNYAASNQLNGTYYMSGKTAKVSSLSNSSTIVGAGSVGSNLLVTNTAKGVIDATGASHALVIATGNSGVAKSNILKNSGLLESTNPTAASSVGGLLISNTVIANSGKTAIIEANGAATHVDLQTATIIGGTLETLAGGVIQTVDRGSILDGSTLVGGKAAPVVNKGTILIAGSGTSLSLKGLITNNGTISVTSFNASQLIAATNTTLSGGGAVTLNEGNYALSNQIYGLTAATSLTNVDNTISGAGQLGAGQLTLINDAAGVIDATGASHQLVINTGSAAVTNGGLIEATGAAGLLITGTTINNGTAGALKAIGSVIDLTSATIVGGTLSDSGGGSFNTLDRGSVLDGSTTTVNNQATFVIGGSGTSLSLKGAINNTGVFSLTSYNASQLIAATNTTLSGGGAVTLNDGPYGASNQIFGATAATSLTNVDNTISGAGQLGAGQLTLVNDAAGVIDATGGSNQLVINTGSVAVSNAGLIEATGTAGLRISGTTISNGSTGKIEALTGSFVDLVSATISGGTLSGPGYFETLDRNSVLDGSTTTVNTSATINIANSGTTLSLKGAINNTGTLSVTSYNASEIVIATNTTLTGTGSIVLNDGSYGASNHLYGATSATTLTNNGNTISGVGQLGDGQLTLINGAAGVIDATGSGNALIINTGAGTLSNAGLIESTAAGGLQISSAISNTGTIKSNGGNVLLSGAVTGAGTDAIFGSYQIEAAAADSNAVSFDSASTGTLKLDLSQSYTGTITGLSTGKTIDLANIAYPAAHIVSYTGNVLTVTDGTTTATLKLAGNYTLGNFHLGTDNNGHTDVTYSGTGMAIPAAAPGVAAMASAMAAMGGGSAASAVTAGAGQFQAAYGQLSLPHAG